MVYSATKRTMFLEKPDSKTPGMVTGSGSAKKLLVKGSILQLVAPELE